VTPSRQDTNTQAQSIHPDSGPPRTIHQGHMNGVARHPAMGLLTLLPRKVVFVFFFPVSSL